MSSRGVDLSQPIKSTLGPRYEVRILDVNKHVDWANAVFGFGITLLNPIFSKLYTNPGARYNAWLRDARSFVEHQVRSELSYGVFDTQYEYRTEEARAAGGKFYGDAETNNSDITTDEALAQMDFPLVAVALSFDGGEPIPHEAHERTLKVTPEYLHMCEELERLDTEAEKWMPEPKQMGELIWRNGTATRQDYEGKGLMKGLAKALLDDAAKNKFRGLLIETVSKAVQHTWMNPPEPYRARLLSEFKSQDFKVTDKEGKETKPFGELEYPMSRIYVHLEGPETNPWKEK